jgi:hypothetical protein
MTDEDKRFIDSLDYKKQYWWILNVEKYGSVDKVRENMSGHAKRVVNYNGGRPKKNN